MKKTKFYALLFFLTVAMSGCDNEYDDTGIRTQIAEVTDQVKALQTLTEALQNRDYILSVVPTTVEGVPGYLITFAQAEPVTILCGTSVIAAVDTSHGDYVVFTLADGTTTITLPRSNAVTIGLDGYDVLYCTASSLDIPLLFPATLKSGDYTSIAATVTNDNGTGTDIQTRASAGTNGVWKVDITQPAFGDDGMIIPNSSKVTLTPPKHVKLSDTAILKVTLVDKKGMETTVTRPIKYSTVAAVTSTAGNLSSVATDVELAVLAIKGSVDATDLAYIRNTLTKLEVLDLSMTDMVTLPGWGLGFHPDDGYQPNTTLKEVMLPASLVTIGKSAFLNCRALDYVDTGNAETITEYAFEGCSNLREVILSEKLKTVGNCAFRNCVSLSLIDIPGSVETLGRWVFENCGNLQSVVLHEGVQFLSESTFYGCGIRSVSIPSTVTAIPNWTFQDCKYLEHVNWHDGITSIGEAAFNRCTSLRNIRIPAGVTSIADDTFFNRKEIIDKAVALPFTEGIFNVLDFSDEAIDIFYDWQNEDIERQNAITDEKMIDSRAAKVPLNTARLALIFQLFRWACDESHKDFVDAESVNAAIRMSDYFEKSYKRMDDLVLTEATDPVKKQVLDSLGNKFVTAEAVKAGADFGFARRTVMYMLKDFCQRNFIIKDKQGNYEKVQK